MRIPVSRLLLVAALAAGFLLGRRFLRHSDRPRPDPEPLSRKALGDAAAEARERRLDEAVEETFPASDAIAVRIE